MGREVACFCPAHKSRKRNADSARKDHALRGFSPLPQFPHTSSFASPGVTSLFIPTAFSCPHTNSCVPTREPTPPLVDHRGGGLHRVASAGDAARTGPARGGVGQSLDRLEAQPGGSAIARDAGPVGPVPLSGRFGHEPGHLPRSQHRRGLHPAPGGLRFRALDRSRIRRRATPPTPRARSISCSRPMRAGVRRVVYASSSAVYGDDTRLPKIESQIGRPLSPYGASKLEAEEHARQQFEKRGVDSVGLRYFNIFGPRQDPRGGYAAVIPQWIGRLLRGEPCVINGDGGITRDYCPVEDAVQANLLAATTRVAPLTPRAYSMSPWAAAPRSMPFIRPDLRRHGQARLGAQPPACPLRTAPGRGHSALCPRISPPSGKFSAFRLQCRPDFRTGYDHPLVRHRLSLGEITAFPGEGLDRVPDPRDYMEILLATATRPTSTAPENYP